MADLRSELSLPPESLRNECDPDSLGFETTAGVPPLEGTIGQERAVNAMQFGLDIGAVGYNLYVSGPSGTGRNTALRLQLEKLASARQTPPDWCYVYNFREPSRPSAMKLPAGCGNELSRSMDELIETCRREIPKLFEDDAYRRRRDEITHDIQHEREQLLRDIEQQAKDRGFLLNTTPGGIVSIPVVDGKPISREEFEAFPEEQRKSIQEKGEEVESIVGQAMTQIRRLDKAAADRTRELDREMTLSVVGPLLREVREKFEAENGRIAEYLDQVQEDIVEHLDDFRATEEAAQAPFQFLARPREDIATRYKVNVVIDNSACKGAPVVVESSPTYYNLFGRVDYRAVLGAMTTDHTMIRPGSIHRANGGYLIVQAVDLLTTFLSWETMKRALRSREARIQNLGEQYSALPTATINAEPIPLDVKVVMVGNPYVYQMLYQMEEDFRKLFRVKADFTVDMARSPENLKRYASFVSDRCRAIGLRAFHKTAVARVVDYGSRLSEHQGKLSTRFIDVADILTEADFWAGKAGSDIVMGEHVRRAVEEKRYRSSLIEERVQELLEDGTIKIDTGGGVVGQVNGIAVYDLGDYRFGRPSRITARVSVGQGQMLNIERESQMSGKIHSKGFITLGGYLHGKYGQERPLSMAASIGFEQTYDEVEGDSASVAELCALLSAIAEAPIDQSLAVTGSVNQRGEVQAIGGASEKVEGFFAVCKARGLTGEQGVALPKDNVKHLMLRDEVVQAVREGRFRIWAVSSVNEALELLTGIPAGEPNARGVYPAGTMHRKVVDRLRALARRAAAHERRRRPKDSEDGGKQEDSRDEE